jgi:tRNA pseudouridine32 synthase/23S rRNA pseudouridine746 synthase
MARTLAANRELARQFAAREVEKFYLSVSDQKPKKKQGMVRGGMMKARRSAWKLTTGSDNLAITQFFSSSVRPGLRLFVLRPLTGKTHQIRVAMKAVGAPILGDVLYGGGGADRGYLHAWSLALNWAGERHCYRCLPEQGSHFLAEDFLQALVQLGAPEQLAWPAVAVPPVTGTGADPDDYS